MPWIFHNWSIPFCTYEFEKVGTYDQFRELFAKKFGITKELSNVFAASMASGLIYSVITMPLETAKNRMAFQKKDPITGILPYRSAVQTISTIASKEGILQLWAGFPPYYLRCGGHTVAMFISVAWLRKLISWNKFHNHISLNYSHFSCFQILKIINFEFNLT